MAVSMCVSVCARVCDLGIEICDMTHSKSNMREITHSEWDDSFRVKFVHDSFRLILRQLRVTWLTQINMTCLKMTDLECVCVWYGSTWHDSFCDNYVQHDSFDVSYVWNDPFWVTWLNQRSWYDSIRLCDVGIQICDIQIYDMTHSRSAICDMTHPVWHEFSRECDMIHSDCVTLVLKYVTWLILSQVCVTWIIQGDLTHSEYATWPIHSVGVPPAK